jgi:hypothetical protein
MGAIVTTKLSVKAAINRGLLLVNGPVVVLMFGIWILGIVIVKDFSLPLLVAVTAFPIGFITAWLWWSITVPKWRLWAMQNVDDLSQLQRQAVAVGLVWPRGHFFEKTEIKSVEHKRQELGIELTYYLRLLSEASTGLPVGVNQAATELQNALLAKSDLYTINSLSQMLKDRLLTMATWSGGMRGLDRHGVQPIVRALDEYAKLLSKG